METTTENNKYGTPEYFTKALKDMIDSCFTYDGADVNSYNYTRYILPYKEKMGSEAFEKVYKEHLEHLTNNFEIQTNVYTDGEGLTYNSLVSIDK